MKVFQVDEYEFYAAKDIEEVKKFYTEVSGMDEEEAFGDDEYPYPAEVNEQEMDELKIIVDANVEEISFRRHLEDLEKIGTKFPCFFAQIGED